MSDQFDRMKAVLKASTAAEAGRRSGAEFSKNVKNYESDPDVFRLAVSGQVLRFTRTEHGYALSAEDLETLLLAEGLALNELATDNLLNTLNKYFHTESE
jgi:hypothetical protein